jgi:hypothetical protein
VYSSLAPPELHHFRLSPDSVRDLGNASLVCKAWSPVAQELLLHIFNILEAGDDDTPTEVIQFIRGWNGSKPLPSRAMLLQVDVDLSHYRVPDLNWVRTLAENYSKLQFFGISFHINRPSTNQLQLVLPLCSPAHAGLTTFCLSICNPQFDREQMYLFHGEPPQKPPCMVVDWIEFLQALDGMPSLNKLIVALHARSGFSNVVEPSTLPKNAEVAQRPSFRLQYLEISTWELILPSWQYEWITASSHSTLQIAIVHLEAVEALMNCRTSLTRLRILDYNRWKTDRFIIPTTTLKLMPTFLGGCPNLVELTTHVEVVEDFMGSPNTSVSLSLERLMIGQLDYDFSNVWAVDYPRVYEELVSGPLSEVVDDDPFSTSNEWIREASKQRWQRRLPNLRTVVVEILWDGEDSTIHVDNVFLMLRKGAQARGIGFWREVYGHDLFGNMPLGDTLGLAKSHGWSNRPNRYR